METGRGGVLRRGQRFILRNRRVVRPHRHCEGDRVPHTPGSGRFAYGNISPETAKSDFNRGRSRPSGDRGIARNGPGITRSERRSHRVNLPCLTNGNHAAAADNRGGGRRIHDHTGSAGGGSVAIDSGRHTINPTRGRGHVGNRGILHIRGETIGTGPSVSGAGNGRGCKGQRFARANRAVVASLRRLRERSRD